jgi:hypothetical protein
MIFSNCAVLKMTSDLYFANRGCVKTSDANGLDQGNVSFVRISFLPLHNMEASLGVVIHITCPSTMMTFHASLIQCHLEAERRRVAERGGRDHHPATSSCQIVCSLHHICSIRFISNLMFNLSNCFSIWYNQEGCGEKSFRSAPS